MSAHKPHHALQEYSSSTLGEPKDAYFYRVAQVAQDENRVDFAVISSNDQISRVSLSETSVAGQSSIPAQHRNVTCIGSIGDHLVTAGNDGKIRIVGSEKHTMDCALPGRPAKSISALACDSSLGLIAVGTASEKEGAGDVEIFLWRILDQNTRKLLGAPKLLRTYTESHMDTITELAFMHLASNELRLVSASTDGLVNVFNPAIEDEDEAVEETINNKSPVHYMTLVPPSGTNSLHSVFVISGDERMMLYQIGEGCSAISNEVDIRETFECDYTVKITTLNSTVYLVTGAYKPETTPSPNVKVWDVSQNSPSQDVSLLASLDGAHGEEVVRDVWWSDEFNVALSCGEDGHVRAWKRSNQGGATSIQETKKPSVQGSGGVKKDARFRPY